MERAAEDLEHESDSTSGSDGRAEEEEEEEDEEPPPRDVFEMVGAWVR
jgi:hypothetical protein